MWTFVIAASVTAFRVTLFDAWAKHRELLFQFSAAALWAGLFTAITRLFQKFDLLAAPATDILKNRHKKLLSIKNRGDWT